MSKSCRVISESHKPRGLLSFTLLSHSISILTSSLSSSVLPPSPPFPTLPFPSPLTPRLTPLSEDLMHLPLARQFVLDGISPRLNLEKYRTLSDAQKKTCIGRSATAHHENWCLLAMETLRSLTGVSSREVEVHANTKPGDRIVIYCDTDEGEVQNCCQWCVEHKTLCSLSSRSISTTFSLKLD